MKQFYDSELLISMIHKDCNNQDDLSKIISACECMKELLDISNVILAPVLNVHQLLAQADAEQMGLNMV
jgi:hypothetical protein